MEWRLAVMPLPLWARPILAAAGAPQVGSLAVVVWPEGGEPWRAGVFSEPSVAHAQAQRHVGKGRQVYLVHRYRGGLTVYRDDLDTVLGKMQAS